MESLRLHKLLRSMLFTIVCICLMALCGALEVRYFSLNRQLLQSNLFPQESGYWQSQFMSAKAQILRRKMLTTGQVTRQGRAIEFFELGMPNRGAKLAHRFLIQGGLHGDEKKTTEFVYWEAQRFSDGTSLLRDLDKYNISVDFLPVANPDGFVAGFRTNWQGVNLNRNFSVLWGISREFPGTSPISEPETAAISAMFKQRHYTAAVDVHGYVNWIVTPSQPKEVAGDSEAAQKLRSLKSKTGKKYFAWTEALKSEMSLLPFYEIKSARGLGDGGAFEDWAFWKQGVYAFCLEMSSHERYLERRYDVLQAIGPGARDGQVDLYLAYESYIYRMFLHAIFLDTEQAASVAAQH